MTESLWHLLAAVYEPNSQILPTVKIYVSIKEVNKWI